MAKFNLYQDIASVKEALALLTILTDKDLLKEVKGVLKDLDNKKDSLNKKIELYGKAKKIPSLVEEARLKAVTLDDQIESNHAEHLHLKKELALELSSCNKKMLHNEKEHKEVSANLKKKEKDVEFLRVATEKEHVELMREASEGLEKAKEMMRKAIDIKKEYIAKTDVLKNIMV